MFNGRIGFDGTATVKTRVIGSYCTPAPKSREKEGRSEILVRTTIIRVYLWFTFSSGLWKTFPKGLAQDRFSTPIGRKKGA
jgi:hypothetical protein